MSKEQNKEDVNMEAKDVKDNKHKQEDKKEPVDVYFGNIEI